MKTMNKLLLILLLPLSVSAKIKNVNDLKLDCHGQYQVLNSTPYFMDNSGTRAPNLAGTKETISVQSLKGKDCEKLAEYYGISLSLGQTLPYGVSTGESYEEALKLASERKGSIQSFSTTLSFSYQTKTGRLPFFPLIHKEQAHVLGLAGEGDVAALYGTPELNSLSDLQKYKVSDEIFSILEFGKSIGSHINFYNQNLLNLALSLVPEEESYALSYLQRLLLVFNNATKYQSSLTPFSTQTNIGHAANKLLNLFGKSKFSESKLQVYKTHPMLFADQLVSWVWKETEKAPQISEEEIEQLLTYFVEKGKILVQVPPQLYEASYLLNQYKNAAKTLQKFSTGNHLSNVTFELSDKSQELISALLELK